MDNGTQTMVKKKARLTGKKAENRVSRRSTRRRSRMIEEHLRQRDQIWEDAAERVWEWNSNKGYVHMPRLLPLVMVLIKALSPRANPASVYLDLWSRCLDGGFLEIDDEESCAYSAGYSGQRAFRTWRERMRTLRDLGFIETKPSGNREFGYVLILDPIRTCAKMRSKAPDAWWTAFISRAKKIGAHVPERLR